MLVVDASMALAWVFPDEAGAGPTEVLHRVDAESALVPAVWPLEVANALIAGERNGRLARRDVGRAFALLAALPISVSPLGIEPDSGLGQVITLAREHQLTAYDAAYLELAVRTASSLATLDKKLGAAAQAAGVALVAG